MHRNFLILWYGCKCLHANKQFFEKFYDLVTYNFLYQENFKLIFPVLKKESCTRIIFLNTIKIFKSLQCLWIFKAFTIFIGYLLFYNFIHLVTILVKIFFLFLLYVSKNSLKNFYKWEWQKWENWYPDILNM